MGIRENERKKERQRKGTHFMRSATIKELAAFNLNH